MGLYVHHSIVCTTKRRADLESERVECMWVEIKHSPSSATLVGYVYRNPAVTYAWFDDFVKMMDKVSEGNSNIVPVSYTHLRAHETGYPGWICI